MALFICDTNINKQFYEIRSKKEVRSKTEARFHGVQNES